MMAGSTHDITATQRSMLHLQRCLVALEKIRGIVGTDSPAGKLADEAMNNRTPIVGGTVDRD